MNGTAKLFISAGLLALSTASFAERGVFLNLAAGETGFNEDETHSGEDYSDSSFHAGIGYYINNSLAAELFYNDFGTATIYSEDADELFDVDSEAISLGIRGRAPMGNKFDIIGRLGASNWEVGSADGTDAYYGGAVAAYLSKHLTLELTLERHEIDDTELDRGSLGLTYTFSK